MLPLRPRCNVLFFCYFSLIHDCELRPLIPPLCKLFCRVLSLGAVYTSASHVRPAAELRPACVYGARLVMMAVVLLLLRSGSTAKSSPCSELNCGLPNCSTSEALSAGFTSFDCSVAALNSCTQPRPLIVTATRSCVRSIGPGGTSSFWWSHLLTVAILLQASPFFLPPALARLRAQPRTRSMRLTAPILFPPQVCSLWFGRAPEPRHRMHWAQAARQRINRTEATAKVGRLVLGLLLALASKASAFADKSSLEGALHEWCVNASGAQATHGHISTWDVRAVTDLSRLVYSAPCRSTFDEDINAWDVGQVTSMDVRCLPTPGGGDGGG